jgi:hypothetical protein
VDPQYFYCTTLRDIIFVKWYFVSIISMNYTLQHVYWIILLIQESMHRTPGRSLQPCSGLLGLDLHMHGRVVIRITWLYWLTPYIAKNIHQTTTRHVSSHMCYREVIRTIVHSSQVNRSMAQVGELSRIVKVNSLKGLTGIRAYIMNM